MFSLRISAWRTSVRLQVVGELGDAAVDGVGVFLEPAGQRLAERAVEQRAGGRGHVFPAARGGGERLGRPRRRAVRRRLRPSRAASRSSAGSTRGADPSRRRRRRTGRGAGDWPRRRRRRAAAARRARRASLATSSTMRQRDGLHDAAAREADACEHVGHRGVESACAVSPASATAMPAAAPATPTSGMQSVSSANAGVAVGQRAAIVVGERVAGRLPIASAEPRCRTSSRARRSRRPRYVASNDERRLVEFGDQLVDVGDGLALGGRRRAGRCAPGRRTARTAPAAAWPAPPVPRSTAGTRRL